MMAEALRGLGNHIHSTVLEGTSVNQQQQSSAHLVTKFDTVKHPVFAWFPKDSSSSPRPFSAVPEPTKIKQYTKKSTQA